MRRMQTQAQVVVGTSYSETFAQTHRIKIPTEIKIPSDARFIPKPHDGKASTKAIRRAAEIILDFDAVAESILKDYKKDWNDIIKSFNIKETLDRFTKQHNQIERLLTIVQKSVLDGGFINPITYLNAKRHFTISKIMLEKIKDIETIEGEVDQDDEGFKLGLFLGLEPIFVISLFSASERNNRKLGQAYGNLVDKYSYMVAQMDTDEYIKSTQLDKPAYSTEEYSQFLSYLAEERQHVSVLL